MEHENTSWADLPASSASFPGTIVLLVLNALSNHILDKQSHIAIPNAFWIQTLLPAYIFHDHISAKRMPPLLCLFFSLTHPLHIALTPCFHASLCFLHCILLHFNSAFFSFCQFWVNLAWLVLRNLCSLSGPNCYLIHKVTLITAYVKKASMTVFVSVAIFLVIFIKMNSTFASLLPSGRNCFFTYLTFTSIFSSLSSWTLTQYLLKFSYLSKYSVVFL